MSAAFTAVQRFGSALNLNVHFHTLCPDGVWEKRDDTLVFVKLGRPTQEELDRMGWRTCERLLHHLRKQGRWVDETPNLDDEDFQQREPLLAEVYGASIRGRLALGPGRGERVMVLRGRPNLSIPPDLAGSRGYTFDVHAAVATKKGDRKALERLCRYLCRPPAANERFEETHGGRIRVRLKSAWSDGTTHVLLTSLQLVEKLVALIPPPRVNMIRYHGAFAPNAAHRAQIVPLTESAQPPLDDEEEEQRCTHAGRQRYALLMKRVFAIDVERCGRCGKRATKIQFLTAKDEIQRVLRSIGYPNAPADAA